MVYKPHVMFFKFLERLNRVKRPNKNVATQIWCDRVGQLGRANHFNINLLQNTIMIIDAGCLVVVFLQIDSFKLRQPTVHKIKMFIIAHTYISLLMFQRN